MLVRQALFWRMIFRWRHNNLSGPGANELLHLLIADLNLFLENGLHPWEGLRSTLLRILRSTWWFRAVLKELWSTFHRLSRVRHGCQLWLIVSIAGSFLLLIQFTSSHGPWLLFAISWTLSSKKDLLMSLTVFLNYFQFSRPFTLVRPSLFGVFGNFQFFCIFSPSLVDDRSELIDYSFQLTDIFNVGCIQRLEVRNDVLDEVGFLVAFWSQGEFRRLNDLFDYKDIDW